jgi:collagenase-like PrtC family protease
MNKNNIIITINDLKDINKLKELGITNIAYPLRDFCVGIPNTFLVSDIKDGYIFINRILDNEGIDNLKKVLKDAKSIKGIIFDDLGVLQVLKDYSFEKILNLTHFNTNSKSINIYLDMVDSIILPTDITIDEIKYICSNANKKISLFAFGYVAVMYSRRLLIDNYSKYHNIPYKNPLTIKNDNNEFLVYENNYGTMFYNNKIFNGLELFDLDCKYFFINSVFLNIDDIKNILEGKIDYLNTDDGFLHKETIYKLKEGE